MKSTSEGGFHLEFNPISDRQRPRRFPKGKASKPWDHLACSVRNRIRTTFRRDRASETRSRQTSHALVLIVSVAAVVGLPGLLGLLMLRIAAGLLDIRGFVAAPAHVAQQPARLELLGQNPIDIRGDLVDVPGIVVSGYISGLDQILSRP